MCGIAVAISPPGTKDCSWAAQRGLPKQHHRGPHARGIEAISLPGAQVSAGMCRLKIVDQSALDVPFRYPRLGITLAFNGEIYNWRQLRQDLPGPWETNCDAEVLAAAWRHWGEQCLYKLNGMWGFVLIDEWEQEIVLCRDRLGQKPLYWTMRGKRLYISSEAKSLPGALETAACDDCEALEYDVRESTPLLGVYRIPPGSIAVLHEPKEPVPRPWWNMPEYTPALTLEQGAEELESLLVDSVRLRTEAEVPVAMMLSGGVDSSILATIAKKQSLPVAFYCMHFSEGHVDHSSAAKLAAGASPLQIVELQQDEFYDDLSKVAYHLDSPATWTASCLWALCRRMASDGNVITLSGEGADELFAGYSRYRILYWLDRCYRDAGLESYHPLIGHMMQAQSEDEVLVRMLSRSKSHRALARCTDLVRRFGGPEHAPLFERMARLETQTTMQVLLRMADRMSAAWSMENRCPFLDYRIIELSGKLRPEAKVNNTTTKAVVRLVAARLGVPEQIWGLKEKHGLAVPWPKWRKHQPVSNRGLWDRTEFANLMRQLWRDSLDKSDLTHEAEQRMGGG